MRSKAQPRSEESRGVRFRDMHWVVCEVLTKLPTPESITVFRLDEREILDNLVSQIRRDCPTLEALVKITDQEQQLQDPLQQQQDLLHTPH